MLRKLLLLCVCLIILCSCDTVDTVDTGNASTPTPIPVPQVFIGSSLIDFQARFAGEYDFLQEGDGQTYSMSHTDIFDVGAPNYTLGITNGKVTSIEVLSNAHNKGAACAVFLPKDKKLVSTFITNTPNSSGAMTNDENGGIKAYTSDWLKKQVTTSSGRISFSWNYVTDDDSICSIGIG